MTQPSEIRPGDRVTLRGSDPPKVGNVIEVLNESAEFRADKPSAEDPGSVPSNRAWVSWDGQPGHTAEKLADLIKLTQE